MYDVIIIGAGVVGSACAYFLSQYQLSLAILEADNDVANGTSKANSAIIHGGYDPKPGSLMAKYNVEGVQMTKDICAKLDVPYKQCGAMVLGFDDEDAKMIEQLYQRGLANGVPSLEVIGEQRIHELEPMVSEKAKVALYVPTSAIVSPWELTLALAQCAVENGCDLMLNHPVTAISKNGDVFTVSTPSGQYQSKFIINAAGVNSDIVHELIGKKEFTIYPTSGQYFLLDKGEHIRANHTLFQCPSSAGKGVLVSPTVHGNLIVGPDSQNCIRDDLSTSSQGLNYVKQMATKSVPSIQFRENIRNFAGIRARSDRGDFIIEESHSIKNFYNLAGMASPGLSSAVAIGAHVMDWLGTKQHFEKKEIYVDSRHKVRMKDLDDLQKNELIHQNSAYGRIVCRCELITEGEILDCFDTPIPPCSIDGVKRRVNAGMGRCQGGFCGPKVAEILQKKLNISPLEVLQDRNGSNIILNQAKEGEYDTQLNLNCYTENKDE